jgi:cytochrome P450
MTTVDLASISLDLTEPGFFISDDYFDVLAALRAHGPAYRTADGKLAISRYDDIRAISRDPARFVSSQGVLINDPLRSDGSAPPNTFSILHLDPPVHAQYRKIVNRQFTPRAAAGLEETVRANVVAAFDAVTPNEEFDGVDTLAATIPIAVIAELFGVGDADRDLFRRWSDAVIATPDGGGGGDAEMGEMVGFLMDHIDSPATEGNDLLNVLKGSELDGRSLGRAEIMGFCMTLLVAGNETTRTLISGGIEALHDHPDQRAALAADPSAIPVGVEELLRWVTPIQAFGRTAVEDVDLDGTTIAAGEFVVMLYASGNRDEATFGPTAGNLDVTRASTPTHVAFGFGEHLCLGAALARLEARVFFEELLARHPAYALTGSVERVASTLVRGAQHMPMILEP